MFSILSYFTILCQFFLFYMNKQIIFQKSKVNLLKSLELDKMWWHHSRQSGPRTPSTMYPQYYLPPFIQIQLKHHLKVSYCMDRTNTDFYKSFYKAVQLNHRKLLPGRLYVVIMFLWQLDHLYRFVHLKSVNLMKILSFHNFISVWRKM